MVAGLIPLYELPLQARGPQLLLESGQFGAAATLMEPAPRWTANTRLGWLPSNPSKAPVFALPSPEQPTPSVKHALFTPMSITHLSSPGPAYVPPSAWRARSQASSPDLETPQSPPRVETSWEVFDYLSARTFADDVSLPELNLGKRLAKRLLRHSHSAHGQGLKVFYIGLNETMLAACPPAAADPAKLVMHATLANALLSHPKATEDLAIKRAIFATKPAGRPGLMRTSNADKVAVWAPQVVGGTRLILHRHSRASQTSTYLSLEPSEHYSHACHEGRLFEQLAAFHANVLHLAGSDVRLCATSKAMQPLAERIEALREARTPASAGMPYLVH